VNFYFIKIKEKINIGSSSRGTRAK